MKLVIKLNGYNVKVDASFNSDDEGNAYVEDCTCLDKFNSRAADEYNSAPNNKLFAAIWTAYDAAVAESKEP